MMASPLSAFGAALLTLFFSTIVGLSITCRLFRNRTLALGFAPTIGWAVFSAAALPILCVAGFGPWTVAALASAALIAGAFALSRGLPGFAAEPQIHVPAFAWLSAALLAAVPAASLLPTYTGDGVLLAAPIFDHSKVAIVDEIVRNGVPAQNPFYGEAGASSELAYYYLWHFSAAMLSLVPGVSGWSADVGLTGFTAFATFAIAIALATAIAGRSTAAWWALALCATASARPLVSAVFGSDVFGTWLSDYPDLGATLVQLAWAPQHVAATGCVVVALVVLCRLPDTNGPLAPLALGLVTAAGFESSLWVGGVVFVLAATMLGAHALICAERRGRLIGRALLAAAVALTAASPILIEQVKTAMARPDGLPIALHPYEVFGPAVSDAIRRPLDLVGFWLVQLPVDLPAIVPAGVLALAAAFRWRGGNSRTPRLALVSTIVAAVSFGVAWLFVSTILNNDLGWRAILPGMFVLTSFAAAGLSRWTERPAKIAASLAAVACLLAGAHGGLVFIRQDVAARPSISANAFSRSPDLWRAVRDHTGPTERIASNPRLFADMTPWPINISWALFADRRSCYAGWEFARPFSRASSEDVDRADDEFRAAFAGTASSEAVRRLFDRHECRIVVVTPADGAWNVANAFAGDAGFELLSERPGVWRIYRYGASRRTL